MCLLRKEVVKVGGVLHIFWNSSGIIRTFVMTENTNKFRLLILITEALNITNHSFTFYF